MRSSRQEIAVMTGGDTSSSCTVAPAGTVMTVPSESVWVVVEPVDDGCPAGARLLRYAYATTAISASAAQVISRVRRGELFCIEISIYQYLKI